MNAQSIPHDPADPRQISLPLVPAGDLKPGDRVRVIHGVGLFPQGYVLDVQRVEEVEGEVWVEVGGFLLPPHCLEKVSP